MRYFQPVDLVAVRAALGALGRALTTESYMKYITINYGSNVFPKVVKGQGFDRSPSCERMSFGRVQTSRKVRLRIKQQSELSEWLTYTGPVIGVLVVALSIPLHFICFGE